jgi:hypothetical protein
MLRRLGVGVVALATLGLVTAGTAGAQGSDSGYGMGSGTDSGMSQGMGPMGMGLGMGPMGMGPGMGMPGMGMGMPGMGMGMGIRAGTEISSEQAQRMGLPPLQPTRYYYPPTMVRTLHPGDIGWPNPCLGCVILVDPCEAYFQCESLPRASWPEGIGLHPTVTYATVQRYSPGGPLSCSFPRGATTIVCSTPGPDDPASWETRTGLDPQ